MKPQSEVGGGRPSKGTLPANNKDASSGQGGYPSGYPVYKPQSEVSVGQGATPPTIVGGRVPRTGSVGNYGTGGPVVGPGVSPNTGASRKPAPVTGPDDKSKDAGVE